MIVCEQAQRTSNTLAALRQHAPIDMETHMQQAWESEDMQQIQAAAYKSFMIHES